MGNSTAHPRMHRHGRSFRVLDCRAYQPAAWARAGVRRLAVSRPGVNETRNVHDR